MPTSLSDQPRVEGFRPRRDAYTHTRKDKHNSRPHTSTPPEQYGFCTEALNEEGERIPTVGHLSLGILTKPQFLVYLEDNRALPLSC